MGNRKRKGLSKKTRFEVFKRDSFTCQYCGRKAPDVVLRVDHVHPHSKGGSDAILNLITACQDCNSGKSDRTLDDASVIEKQRQQLEQLQERREQLDMMLKWQESLVNLDLEASQRLSQMWSQLATGWTLNESGMKQLRRDIRKFGVELVAEAMRDAADQYIEVDPESGQAVKESVGVAWVYVRRIAGCKKAQLERPYLRDAFYIRGIIRKRFQYCNDGKAMALLSEAFECGATQVELKNLACDCRNWTSWEYAMETLISECGSDVGQTG